MQLYNNNKFHVDIVWKQKMQMIKYRYYNVYMYRILSFEPPLRINPHPAFSQNFTLNLSDKLTLKQTPHPGFCDIQLNPHVG